MLVKEKIRLLLNNFKNNCNFHLTYNLSNLNLTFASVNFNKQPDRIQKMHRHIQTETTGCPEQFAQQLHLGRRQLYNELERLKELDAPIKYCKKRVLWIDCRVWY